MYHLNYFKFRASYDGCQLGLFFVQSALYFYVMSLNSELNTIQLIGVALEGLQGMPVIVFENPVNGEFLTVAVDPFDAEILIRDYIGEAGHSAAAWLGELLESSPPSRGILDMSAEGIPLIRMEFGILRSGGLKKHRVLSLSEGLILSRRLSIPLSADEQLFDTSREELSFLAGTEAFSREFFYLTPPQYAPNIPVI